MAGPLADISVGFYAAYCGGEPVGSFELCRSDGSVRIEAFGLLEPYRGSGLGHCLLTRAVESAFAMGAEHIWLEMPVHAHSAVLPLFRSQGFRPSRLPAAA